MPTIKESHISERIEKSEIPLSNRPTMLKKQKNVQNENSVKSCNCYKLREYCSAVVVLLTSLLS